MMHPDTSIMNGSQACSCTVCSNQQAVCGFQLLTKQAGFKTRPVVHCRRSINTHSLG